MVGRQLDPKKLKERKEKLGKLPNGAEENKGYFF